MQFAVRPKSGAEQLPPFPAQPFVQRDSQRRAAWPARLWCTSSASRASRHTVGCALTHTLGPMKPVRQSITKRRHLKHGTAAAERAREKLQPPRARPPKIPGGYVLVNPANLRPTNSYGTPEFVQRGYYVDRPFHCKACGSAQLWTDTQQKWWYESAKGDVWTVAILCRPCRQRERARKAAARETHLSGIAAKSKNVA
jgi:hypothetical protein